MKRLHHPKALKIWAMQTLHKRAIVGTLLQVGQGKLSIEGFNEIILKRDRCSAGTSVPGEALFLVDIGYPQELFEQQEKEA